MVAWYNIQKYDHLVIINSTFLSSNIKGLVVTNDEVGWSISKKKDSHCILWLGPNKTASRVKKK